MMLTPSKNVLYGNRLSKKKWVILKRKHPLTLQFQMLFNLHFKKSQLLLYSECSTLTDTDCRKHTENTFSVKELNSQSSYIDLYLHSFSCSLLTFFFCTVSQFTRINGLRGGAQVVSGVRVEGGP